MSTSRLPARDNRMPTFNAPFQLRQAAGVSYFRTLEQARGQGGVDSKIGGTIIAH